MAFPDTPASHLIGSNGPVHTVAYSASPGAYILTGSADRSIRLYNPFPSTSSSATTSFINGSSKVKPAIPQGRLIQTYAAHGYEVLSLAVSADNERFISAGRDRAVFMWDVATAKTTRRFGGNAHGHSARVNCVCYAGASDSVIVSGSFDTTVRLWDVRSGGAGGAKPIQVLTEARDDVTSLAVRGPEIVVGSVDGCVRSYDVRVGKCTTDTIGASVTSVHLARDAQTVLVASLDSKLRLLDRATGKCLMAYADPGWRNEELRIQAIMGMHDKYVLTGDEMTAVGDEAAASATAAPAGRLWVWDVLTGKVAAKISVPWGPAGHEPRKKVVGQDGKEKARTNVVSCMAWRDDGRGDQFCVGGNSGVVTVYGKL